MTNRLSLHLIAAIYQLVAMQAYNRIWELGLLFQLMAILYLIFACLTKD